MGRVDGKVAVVTGAALGIGKATCELLAREGARVAVTEILDEEGRKLAEEIHAAGGTARFWHLDVTGEQHRCNGFSAKWRKPSASSTCWSTTRASRA